MSPLYTPLDTTTNVFTSPLPTDHLALFADHLHLALFDDNIHTTPRKPSPTHYGFGGTCER